MQREGFTADEAARFAHRFYRTFRARVNQIKDNQSSPNGKKSPFGSPSKKGLSIKDQQLELINLSQNVHLMNQDVNKILRKNKSGIPLSMLNKLPPDYKRPPGFLLVPGLLGSIPGGKISPTNHHINGKQNDRNNNLDHNSNGMRLVHNKLFCHILKINNLHLFFILI